ncbi:hypothetical protein EX30DRAFT_333018 [Ascodesmis nigricans]|uniref:Plasma membrane fusion protein PRM1 n=1 Tax=Ascodesmis nigricans TaxID=341454 RepID=A0A4S2MTH1_9PEZI|nr:hypothetical protein EX30DRAFT_333018 [Ascodesmis nigricans]
MDCPSYEDATSPPRRPPPTTGDLKPYLGLQARLSQIWFNRWTLLLFLVLVRVLLSSQSLNSDLNSAQDKALSACTSVESMGTAMASMPHYMSSGVNEIAASGIEAAVAALEKTLLLLITAVQEIVIFIINVVTSTYLCLITFAIKGSVGLVVDATKEITEFLNKASADIFDGIQKEIGGFQSSLNNVMKAVEKVPSFFGADIDIPEIKLPTVDRLKNGLKIPTEFVGKMEEFEKGLPDFKEVQKAANDVIRIPFQKIHKAVNESLTSYTFDRSIFPVPAKEKLTFCSSDPFILTFFNNLFKTITTLKWALIGTLLALSLLAMIPMSYREIRRWRLTRDRAYTLTDPARNFDPIDIVMISAHPHSSEFGLKLAGKVQSRRRQMLVRWAVAYVTTPAALFVLALGVAGLAGVLCQYIVLKQVEGKAPELAREVGGFAGLVVDKLDAVSGKWGESMNSAVKGVEGDLNGNLFGWVKEGTDALNGTLNTLVDEMTKGIDGLLGDSPLKKPLKDVLDCLLFFKIQGIQTALTWVHTNAHVSLPRLPPTTFSSGASDSMGSSDSFLSNPGAKASDEITDVVLQLTTKWAKMLRQEAIIAACITAIWFLCLLIALIRTAVLFNGKDSVRGEGGPQPKVEAMGADQIARQQVHANLYAHQMTGGSWGQGERKGSQGSVGPFGGMFANTSPGDEGETPLERRYRGEGGMEERVRMGAVGGGKGSFENPGWRRDSLHAKSTW